MTMTANHAKLDDRGRQSLRLDPEVWTAIDTARLRRAGSISRNTWITEAIAEKLAREQNNDAPRREAWGGHV
jgi:predicted transcriptional regulator